MITQSQPLTPAVDPAVDDNGLFVSGLEPGGEESDETRED